MDADDVAGPSTLRSMALQRRIQEAEASREQYEEAVRRKIATGKEEARKKAKKKKKSAKRKKRFSESQERLPSEEQVPAINMMADEPPKYKWHHVKAEMHSEMHGQELPDWMSQLFEKLDLEVNEDNICSTENVIQEEAHPKISSRICIPTKLEDSSMADTDASGFRWMSVEDNGLIDDDELLDWIVDMLKKGGHDDLLARIDLDHGAARNDVQDEDAEDSHTSVKRVSNKETLENGIKWMSEECLLAFTESVERKCFEGIEHRFGELRGQCLNIEAYDKIFHHYNFTIEAKHGSSDIWSSKLYFAEVKQLFGLKSYFCCPLEDTDNGRCYGCQNMKCDLQHPTSGGYEEGNADICWPFIDATDSSSDDDCGFGC